MDRLEDARDALSGVRNAVYQERRRAERSGDAEGVRLAREALAQVLETIDAVDALRRHAQVRESARLLERLTR